MANLYSYVLAILLLALAFFGIKLLYRSRAKAMRALALESGFQFTAGEPLILHVPKGHRPFPESFQVRGSPWNTVTRAWNLIEGEKDGVKIFIFDGVMGGLRATGAYSTFIAVRTDKNPFANKSPKEKIARSNGWTALYRLRILQVPWTLSIERIEEHLNSLGA